MNEYTHLSKRIETALKLETPAVAVTFTNSTDTSANKPSKAAPAGCSFWEIGSQQTIVTHAEDHQHCSIGIHTHNLVNAPATQQQELETTLGAMSGLDYVRPNEVEALPVVTNTNQAVIYGPLSDATETPAVVLLFCDAELGVIVSEALARVDGAVPLAMGRPACALIPQVVNNARSASSLGCCGARAYLDVMSEGVTLWGLYGQRLADYTSEIETMAKANTVLTQFHDIRRKAIETGESPSVEQSLAELT